jgi:hypothetical protein
MGRNPRGACILHRGGNGGRAARHASVSGAIAARPETRAKNDNSSRSMFGDIGRTIDDVQGAGSTMTDCMMVTRLRTGLPCASSYGAEMHRRTSIADDFHPALHRSGCLSTLHSVWRPSFSTTNGIETRPVAAPFLAAAGPSASGSYSCPKQDCPIVQRRIECGAGTDQSHVAGPAPRTRWLKPPRLVIALGITLAIKRVTPDLLFLTAMAG